MAIARRVKMLERSRPRMIVCPSCGGMDRVQRGGPVRFASLLQRVDGRVVALCKMCGDCYEGHLLDPAAAGAVRLVNVVSGEMPV